ncbi:MAG: type II secretion system F family protein [Bacilli bacterium]|nr:type II secretion system F family protein [Bacilli bacterium]
MEEHYISKKLYSKKSVKEIDKKIKLLGVSTKINCYLFLNIRFFGMILLFIIILYSNDFGYLLAPILSIIYYKGITYLLLDYRIKERQTNLEMEALNFFEILTLSLETGRNLQEALNITLSSCEGELVNEFREVMREVKYGKSLTEALEDMQQNIPSDTINNIILSLTQANLYGSSIIKSLYNQIDYLREKRKLEVKAEISKVPIKISIISVFFFVPLVLIIILAPVLLGYIGS